MQMSKEKHAFKVSCNKEFGGHAWAGIEYWGGMCGLGENRERVCMG